MEKVVLFALLACFAPGQEPTQQSANESIRSITVALERDIEAGRYAHASERLEEVKALIPQADDFHARRATRFVATFLFKFGLHQEALQWTGDAIELALAAKDEETRADALNTRGLVYEELGDLEAARSAWGEAIEILEPHTALAGRARVNRGRAARLLGDLADARQDFERVLEMIEERKELGKDPDLGPAAVEGLALLLIAEAEHAEALQLIAPIVDGQRARGDDEMLLYSLATLAQMHLGLGELDAAGACIDEAQRLLDKMAELGPWPWVRLRSRYSRWAELAQEHAIQSHVGLGAAAKQLGRGLQLAEAWRARALLSSLAADHGDLDLDALRSELGPRRVLIEYANGTEHLYAYVLTAPGLELVQLGSLKTEIDPARRRYDAALFLDKEQKLDDLAGTGKALYDLLLGPVVELLPASVDELVIVPSETLQSVPFDALVMDRIEERTDEHPDGLIYVLDRWTVVYSPSASLFAFLARRGPRDVSGKPGRRLLMGDAIFPREATPKDRSGPAELAGYGRLLATRQEVLEIARHSVSDSADPPELKAELDALQRGGERSAALSSAGFDLFLGEDASIEVFDRPLQEYETIHLSTHGIATANAKWTGLLFSPGANGQRLLDVEAIRRLQLDANAVVMPACDSAIGRVLKGEGPQSVAASFLEAGARGVIATLRSVDDSYARDLMLAYYDAIDGARPAAALRQAKLKLRKRTRRGGPEPETGTPPINSTDPPRITAVHPSHWASFIYIGHSMRTPAGNAPKEGSTPR